MKALIIALLLVGEASAATLEECQVQEKVLAKQVELVRQVRDFYEAQLAHARAELDAVKAELERVVRAKDASPSR